MIQAIKESTKAIPAQKDALTASLKKTLSACKLMVKASRKNDALGLMNAGLELKVGLRELWSLRSLRNRNWGKSLNFLQSALANCTFENFTLQQCQAVEETLLVEINMPQPASDDVRQVIRRLKKAKLDPWTGLSAADTPKSSTGT